MAQEDIVKMARKAGIAKYGLGWTCWEGQLEAFAALVAAAERESVAASSKRDLTCVCGAVWDGEQMVHAPRKREWVGLPESALAGMTLQQVSAMKYAELVLKEKNT